MERNVVVDRGEIDIVAVIGNERTAVEVRSITGPGPPTAALDDAKVDRVWRAARALGCTRVDLVAVRLGPEGVTIHWVPFVS